MQRRCFTTTCARLQYGRAKKKLHWTDEIKLLNNVNRAMTHFDDFYASVYNKQWPSLRLGLLSPPKYMAIPNSFTGDLEGIAKRLEGLGAYNIQDMWMKQQAEMELERKEVDLRTDLGRLHQLDQKLEAIAATKRAEELDVLYQNAPTSKREEMRLGKGPSGRIVSDISEAAADFVPSSRLKGVEDFTFDSEYFSSYLRKHDTILDDDLDGNEDLSGDFREVQFLQTSTPLEFPKLLLPMAFENGSALMFPAAARESKSGHREYICINGASILPVIALDLRPGTKLLDMCAGPGTKSVLSLMTLSVDSITCNDLESSRLYRIKRIMEEFTGSSQPSLVTYSRYNARDYPAEGEYTRVLADVPCLNDRVSSTVKENNIFKPRRTKERLNLVKTQKGILMSGFKTLSKDDGSTIVYSTCTLSPIENDGVVMNALKETEVPDLHIDLKGLVKLVTPFERAGIFKIMRTRCGVLVLPNVVCNFGPMYISRIVVKSTTTNANESETVEQQ